MAHDRYWNDRDRQRGWDMSESDWRDRNEGFGRRHGSGDRPDDDGYIARRGFGNPSAGYGRGRGAEERFGSRHERDYGDSAGYGTGGSALDWREVVGQDRGTDEAVFGRDFGRGGSYRSSYERDSDRYGGSFGRGSRDYNEERGFFERAGDEVRSWFGDEDADRRRQDDMRSAEHHRGRGPKGYQRSDERIREDVNDRLTDDPHVDASEIEVAVANREVTLTGTVNSRFEKRHAEDLAESISGVTHVQNNLRVQQQAPMGMGGSMLPGQDSSTDTGTASGTGDMPAGRRRTTGSSDR
jgi:osmotically-inducible protein OsmY